MGNIPGPGATTRQWSHYHAIFAVQRTNREWTEKVKLVGAHRSTPFAPSVPPKVVGSRRGKLAVMRVQNAERGKRILIFVLLSVCNDDPCAEAPFEFALVRNPISNLANCDAPDTPKALARAMLDQSLSRQGRTDETGQLACSRLEMGGAAISPSDSAFRLTHGLSALTRPGSDR